MHRKGQGALEYLLIIGAAALVAVLIIGSVLQLSIWSGDSTTSSFANAQCLNFSKLLCGNGRSIQVQDKVFFCEWDSAEEKCLARLSNEHLVCNGNRVCETALGEDFFSCPQDCPVVCGNGSVDAGEACDGAALQEQTCLTIPGDFWGGSLSCLSDCSGFNTGACVKGVGEQDFVLDVGAIDDANPAQRMYLSVENGLSDPAILDLRTVRMLSENSNLSFFVNTSSLSLAPNGVPYTDAILELSFKDTVDQSNCGGYQYGYEAFCRPHFQNRLDFAGIGFFDMSGFGGKNDNQWKTVKVFFKWLNKGTYPECVSWIKCGSKSKSKNYAVSLVFSPVAIGSAVFFYGCITHRLKRRKIEGQ